MNKFEEHKFLLIDDSEIDSVITSKILQLSGLPKANIVARHAFEALDYLRTEVRFPVQAGTGSEEASPLIILLDIHMPEMSGFEFLEYFGQLDPHITDNCRIFLLTSSIDPIDIERAHQNGYVVRVLNKPLNMEELLYYFEAY